MADCYFHGQSAPGPCPECEREDRARAAALETPPMMIVEEPEAEEARLDAERALRDLVAAWEALPGGDHPTWRVARWLADDMAPAIDAARRYLGETK